MKSLSRLDDTIASGEEQQGPEIRTSRVTVGIGNVQLLGSTPGDFIASQVKQSPCPQSHLALLHTWQVLAYQVPDPGKDWHWPWPSPSGLWTHCLGTTSKIPLPKSVFSKDSSDCFSCLFFVSLFFFSICFSILYIPFLLPFVSSFLSFFLSFFAYIYNDFSLYVWNCPFILHK